MPQLSKPLEKKKVFLPSTKEAADADKAWIVMEVGAITGGDMMSVGDFSNSAGITLQILAARILEWNFTDMNGTVDEINIDSVKRLDPVDLAFLITEFGGGSETAELPKASSSSSSATLVQ